MLDSSVTIGTGDGGQGGGRGGDIGSHNTLVTHFHGNQVNQHATPLKGDSLSSLAILV